MNSSNLHIIGCMGEDSLIAHVLQLAQGVNGHALTTS